MLRWYSKKGKSHKRALLQTVLTTHCDRSRLEVDSKPPAAVKTRTIDETNEFSSITSGNGNAIFYYKVSQIYISDCFSMVSTISKKSLMNLTSTNKCLSAIYRFGTLYVHTLLETLPQLADLDWVRQLWNLGMEGFFRYILLPSKKNRKINIIHINYMYVHQSMDFNYSKKLWHMCIYLWPINLKFNCDLKTHHP